jgi:hypothetical protein
MKVKVIVLGLLLFVSLAFKTSGQEAKTAVISEPTFEKKTDNVDLQVWIIPENKKLSDTSSTSGMGSRVDLESNQVITEMPDLVESLPQGTHYITLRAKESGDGKVVEESPKVLITGPSKEAVSIQLKGRKNNYAGSLILKEKGEYNFTISVNVSGIPETFPFKYTVK